ncbi:hypothetical protein Tco_1273765 [Tanacetum coccineum]
MYQRKPPERDSLGGGGGIGIRVTLIPHFRTGKISTLGVFLMSQELWEEMYYVVGVNRNTVADNLLKSFTNTLSSWQSQIFADNEDSMWLPLIFPQSQGNCSRGLRIVLLRGIADDGMLLPVRTKEQLVETIATTTGAENDSLTEQNFYGRSKGKPSSSCSKQKRTVQQSPTREHRMSRTQSASIVHMRMRYAFNARNVRRRRSQAVKALNAEPKSNYSIVPSAATVSSLGGGGDGEDGLERFSRSVIGDSDRVIPMKECFGEVVSLVDVVLDGAFGGVGEEEVVVGDGVERFSLSLVRSTNSCFGGMIVSLIFLNPWEEDACVSMEV